MFHMENLAVGAFSTSTSGTCVSWRGSSLCVGAGSGGGDLVGMVSLTTTTSGWTSCPRGGAGGTARFLRLGMVPPKNSRSGGCCLLLSVVWVRTKTRRTGTSVLALGRAPHLGCLAGQGSAAFVQYHPLQLAIPSSPGPLASLYGARINPTSFGAVVSVAASTSGSHTSKYRPAGLPPECTARGP
ncbi:unnamed protein product [Trypanosoma congolense IL3000]|uniref:WGS project CAEQ00000000 data, annotated contig 1351 n=1 Tax=Trypanosoma congolense (strain IL3000) TaxID=1068625 RepID=F9W5N5_TRYCI|nr:unnamed protein product [Trypanosoma congolense IL3000]